MKKKNGSSLRLGQKSGNARLIEELEQGGWFETNRDDLILAIFNTLSPRSEGKDKISVPPALDAIFQRYHFVSDECIAAEDDVTPAVLSDVYEKLNGGANGAYYSPPDVVRYMCEESLISWLCDAVNALDLQAVRRFVSSRDRDAVCGHRDAVREALSRVTVFDPAVGCGAFLVEMLHLLAQCRCAVDPDVCVDDIRAHIVQNCLFGADIDGSAVRITCQRLALNANLNEDSRHFHVAVCNALRSDYAQMPGFDVVMKSGGFDIVIANPPYGVKMSDDDKKCYRARFSALTGRFDIYMVFLELGLELSKNIVCFITPDKWLSKSFALKFRETRMIPYLERILHLGNAVFQTALVDSIVSLFNQSRPDSLHMMISDSENRFHEVNIVDKAVLKAPFLIDCYFQAELPAIVAQLEQNAHVLGDYARCEYALANPKQAYEIKPMIYSCEQPGSDEFRLINTGTIGVIRSCWSLKPMKYLNDSHVFPVVRRHDVALVLGESYVEKMSKPKVIIKGLNRLDCCIDLNGDVLPAIGTLCIRAESGDLLKILTAILNTGCVMDYIRAKYVSSSYCGGLLFTLDMINRLPVPDLSQVETWRDVVSCVDHVCEGRAGVEELEKLVRAHYLLDI